MSRNRRFWLLIVLTSFEGSNIPCPDLQPRRTRQTDNLVRSDFVQCTRSVFAPDLMRQCMGGSVPMVLTLPVDAPAMQHNLLHYASRDSANFSSHTGDHHTKLGDHCRRWREHSMSHYRQCVWCGARGRDCSSPRKHCDTTNFSPSPCLSLSVRL